MAGAEQERNETAHQRHRGDEDIVGSMLDDDVRQSWEDAADLDVRNVAEVCAHRRHSAERIVAHAVDADDDVLAGAVANGAAVAGDVAEDKLVVGHAARIEAVTGTGDSSQLKTVTMIESERE